MPRRSHHGGECSSTRHDCQGNDGDFSQAVPNLKSGGEWPDEAEEQHIDTDCKTDCCPTPAEFVTQRVDEDAGGTTYSGGTEKYYECRTNDDPMSAETGPLHIRKLVT